MPWTAWLAGALACLVVGGWAFRRWFRRDPQRQTPDGPVIVAPADGRILDVCQIAPGEPCRIPKGMLGQVETLTSELGDGPFTLISIFMTLFNVHVNRSPIAGTVLRVEHHPGRLRPANHPRALENEKTEMVLETPIGRVKVLQIAGLVARRIDNWLGVGQHLATGERIGLIHFGSQVSIVLPQTAGLRVTARRRQKVRAGETVLATYGQTSEPAGH